MFSNRTNWKLTHNRLAEAIDAARSSGVTLLDLTASNPTRVGLHYDSQLILDSLGSDHSLDYDPQSFGLLAAREAVVRYYRDQHRADDLDPKSVCLTTSTSEGYSFVFRLLCNAGDELLVPKPSYPLFEFLADLQDVKLAPYPLMYDHGWQIDLLSLERAITEKTRGIVLVHPNNPTGSYVHGSEIDSLNALCRKHSLALVVDEVFLDHSLDGVNHPSFVTNGDTLTFTLSGLSKISALPQMKVAWVATSGPEQQVHEAVSRLEVIADTYLSMNAPIQWAVPVLLQQRVPIQSQLLDRVQKNLGELDRQLSQQKTCQRLLLEGGWYAVLRVPVTRSDEDLAIALLKEKSVLVHPGHFYDFPKDGYLILSLITNEQDFAEGIHRIFLMFEQ